MSSEEPTASDSVILGSDLVAALGFEPVDGGRGRSTADKRPSTATVVGEADRDDDQVDSLTDDPVVVAGDIPEGREPDAPEETEMSIEIEPEAERIDDIEVLPEPSVLDADESVGAAPRRSRFGVRGLLSRRLESELDDESASGGQSSTRDLFSNELADPDPDPDGAMRGFTDTIAEPDEAIDDRNDEQVESEPFAGLVAEAATSATELPAPPEPDLIAPPPPTAADAVSPRSTQTDDPAIDVESAAGSALPAGPTIDLDSGTLDGWADSLPDAETSSLAVTVGEPAPVGPAVVGAAARPASGRTDTKLRARKSRRVIRHIDPWSVLTFSILFHLAFFASLLLAGVIVWNAAIAAGTIDNIENFIRQLADYQDFQINSDQVFKAAVVIAGMLTLASSVLVVLLTVVFNLISDLIGGIRVTVIEEETVRLPPEPRSPSSAAPVSK